MANGDIGTVIDSLEFDTGNGIVPNIIHISGDVFAVAYEGVGNDGWLCTFTIDSAGNIGAAVIDTLEFDTVFCRNPKIVRVSGDIYAIVYEGTDTGGGTAYDGWLVTMEIDTAGNIGAAVIDSHEFDTSQGEYPSILPISGNVFAIVYEGDGDTGQLKTLTINSDGTIDASPEIDSFQFDALAQNPNLIHVTGNVFAIAYSDGQGANYAPAVITVTISSAGDIGAAVVDSLELETASVNQKSPSIIRASGNIYAVAYMGEGGALDGWLVTFTIDSSGNIGASILDSLEYDLDVIRPKLINIAGDVFGIADYSLFTSVGFIKTCTIDSAGNISTVIDSLVFDTVGKTPSLIVVPNTSILAVVYAGSGDDGWVKTAGVTYTAPAFTPRIFYF